jgi:hypothetical protein
MLIVSVGLQQLCTVATALGNLSGICGEHISSGQDFFQVYGYVQSNNSSTMDFSSLIMHICPQSLRLKKPQRGEPDPHNRIAVYFICSLFNNAISSSDYIT